MWGKVRRAHHGSEVLDLFSSGMDWTTSETFVAEDFWARRCSTLDPVTAQAVTSAAAIATKQSAAATTANQRCMADGKWRQKVV